MSTDYMSVYEPEPELSFYWDPRYKAYFYRGDMPSPTGDEALQALYAAPVVELLPTDEPSVDPILVSRDEEGYRTRASTGRRITWLLSEPPKDTEEWDIPCSVPVLVVVALTLSAVTLMVLIMLWEGLKEQYGLQDESTTEEDSDELDLELASFKARQRTRGPLVRETTLLLPSSIDSRPKSLALNVFQQAPAYVLPTVQSICFASDSVDSHLLASEDKLDLLPFPAPCCEAVVLCCSVINDDFTLQPLPLETDAKNTEEPLSHSRHCHGRTVRKIIGVRVTESTFSRLAGETDSTRPSFFQSILHSLNMFSFNGVAVLLRDIPEKGKKSVVNVIESLLKELRQHSYTLTLLLPYKAGHHEAYSEKLDALREVLVAPHSLFLYPDVRMLGNTTRWPSPSEFRFPAHENDARNGSGVCHLFSKQPFLVALSEACDTSKIQAIVQLKRPHVDDVAYACSMWNQSWASSANRYNTFTCLNRTGILYQTGQQAQSFYRDLVTRIGSLCYGVVDWEAEDFPAMCGKDNAKLK